MSDDQPSADEFMGHISPAPSGSSVPDAHGMYTFTGEARNVRAFTEDTGWGNTRQTIQVVSFTLDQFEAGGLKRSVYAEIRGRSVGRRPVENESVTVRGRFVDGRLEIAAMAGLRDDPNLPINVPVPWLRRHRKLIIIGSLVVAALVVVGCIGPIYLLQQFNEAVGPPPQRPAAEVSAPGPIIVAATGQGPWSISGVGYTFEIVSVKRTRTTPWMGQPTSSLTLQGYVTRTESNDFTSIGWELRNQAGTKLAGAALGADAVGAWETRPTLGQRLPITLVVYDSSPRATTLTLTITDFYRSDESLILRDIPVPR